MPFSNIQRLEKLFEAAIRTPCKSELYKEQLKEFHFSPSRQYCAAIVSLHKETTSSGYILKLVNDQIIDVMAKKELCAFSYLSASNIILIFTDLSPNEAENQIKLLLSAFPNERFDISVGRSMRGIQNLSKSYTCAEKIQQKKKSHKLPDFVSSYNEVSLYRMISTLQDHAILEQIHNDFLEPLISYDAVRGTEYMDFLFTYLRHEGHVNEIAELMYVHKNTVLYKVRKIETILDCDLSKLENRILLTIACVNYQIQNNA